MGPTRRRNSRIVNGIESLLLAPTPKVSDTLTHASERFQANKRYCTREVGWGVGMVKVTKVSPFKLVNSRAL